MIPNMRRGLLGWIRKRNIKVITQSIVDGFVTEGIEDKYLKINIQPVPSEKVNRKPEEQRSWKWFNIFCDSSLILKIDDRIVADKTYKICEINNWSEAGICSYEAIEDFTEYIPST
jgi:hypothetical protein